MHWNCSGSHMAMQNFVRTKKKKKQFTSGAHSRNFIHQLLKTKHNFNINKQSLVEKKEFKKNCRHREAAEFVSF